MPPLKSDDFYETLLARPIPTPPADPETISDVINKHSGLILSAILLLWLITSVLNSAMQRYSDRMTRDMFVCILERLKRIEKLQKDMDDEEKHEQEDSDDQDFCRFCANI